MPKEEWGTKRLCPQCQTRFYDLKKDPMTCPACGAEFSLENLIQSRGRPMAADKVTSKTDDQDDDLIETEVEADDAADIGDDLLEDDDDDGDVSLDEIADVAEDDDE